MSSHFQAEALLQTITGITGARIVDHPAGGIAVVRVVCNDAVSRGQVVRNVRSALFAGFGIAVSTECIDFVAVLDAAPAAPALVVDASKSETASKGASHKDEPGTKRTIDLPVPVLPRPLKVANARGYSAVPAAQYQVTESGPLIAAMPRTNRAPRILQVEAPVEEMQEPAVASSLSEAVPSTEAVGANVRNIVARAASLKLESVEMRRQSGRLRCRVVISLGNDHFGAVADTTDPSAGEIHLAGRVACDALRAGGFTDARFDGAAIAQINGRQHVVVALSEWTGGETMVLSGAAPLEEVPERAAAVAAIKAVLAQDIN